MKHVVLSTDASGQPKIDEVTSLDEALELVERLRNDDEVTDVRVLREVPIQVKTYFKVMAVEDDADAAEASVRTSPPPAAARPTAATPRLTAEEVAQATADAGVLRSRDEQPTASIDLPAAEASGPRTDPAVDDGFFTPPPVRSHPVDEDLEPTEEASSAERRTSLFGRG
jgi:hypothetical protein